MKKTLLLKEVRGQVLSDIQRLHAHLLLLPLPVHKWAGLLQESWLKAIRIMRWLLLITGLICCTAFTLYAGNVKGQSVLDKEIDITLKDEVLKTAIDKLAAVSGARFSYSDEVANSEQKVSISAKKTPLKKVLNDILTPIPFKFLAIEGEIVVWSEHGNNFSEDLNNRKDQSIEKTVSGVVTDSLGMPLPGVTVQVKGTNIGTATNINGEYLLSNIPDHAELVFSMIGYQGQIIYAENQSVVNIILKEKLSDLDEVVVSTGYQTIPQERATGSFVQVSNKLVNRRVSTNILDRLEGVVPGLLFNSSSTAEPTISIRGNSTIYANESPLIILDGFAFDGDINAINPNDIQNITVLKDAAAASIWGVRAGNGVIVITTQKGDKSTPLNVSFNSNVTISERPDSWYKPQVSTAAFIDMEQYLFDNDYYTSEENNMIYRPALSPVVELLIANRDGNINDTELSNTLDSWKKVDVRDDFDQYFIQPSINQQYALNLNGGSKTTKYLFSAGYDKNREYYVGNELERFTLRSENTFTLFKNLNLTAGVMVVNRESTKNNPGLELLNATTSKKGLYPYAELVDVNGDPLTVNWQYRRTFTDQAIGDGLLDWNYQPLKELRLANNPSKDIYTRLHAGINYHFLKRFSADVKYQFEQNVGGNTNLHTVDSYHARDRINSFTQVSETGALEFPVPVGSIKNYSNNRLTAQTIRSQLNFEQSWGIKHFVTAIAGFEAKESRYTSDGTFTLYGYDENLLTSIPVDYTTRYMQYYSSALTDMIPGGVNFQRDLTDRFLSYYGNMAYTYATKYTFSLSARRDESNLFGLNANQRSVPLWSTGVSWNIGEENLLNKDIVNHLILRATYGYSGNIDKSVTALTTTRRSTDRVNRLPKAEILNPPNANLSWEKVGILNMGLDFEIAKGLLTGSVEWYAKRGSDLLGFEELDPTTGMLRYKGNVASMKGNGIDVRLDTRNIDQKVKWYTTFMYSHSKDRITDMNIGNLTSNRVAQQEASFNGTNVNIVPMVGNAIYGVYSYRWAGLDANTGDPLGLVDEIPSQDYAAIRSAPAEKLRYHGSSRPTHFGSLRNTVLWKGFEFSFNITYKLGYFFRRSTIDFAGIGRNWGGHKDYEQRWQQPGDEQFTIVPSMPLINNQSRNDFYKFSEPLVLSGSHIRLQDINVNYTVPIKRDNRSGISNMNVYLYVNNLGILWRQNKEDIDPDFNPVMNMVYLPSPRTYSIGFRVSF